ncbi:MAG: endonuclease/exonuclease/phosphatase family protein [Bdellovibrionaceae bacterium]|nr:endonuclease/exonuclease/phosphatase family protein [Pseudobdellovibrionaceae bacterium]
MINKEIKLKIYSDSCYFSTILLIMGLLVSCVSTSKVQTKDRITVMTFNVENLFDTKDDVNKNDDTFLPLALKKTIQHKKICAKARFPAWVEQCLYWDWNEDVVNIKLSRLAQVFHQVNLGKGPDFVLLQEIENKEILERLNQEYKLGFKEIVLIEGADVRGIDVAIMSKFPLKEKAKLHYVKFKNISKDRIDDTRGILEATFELENHIPITLFSAHFPAPFHPVEMREQSLQTLNQLLFNLPQDRIVVAGGDFNIPSEEDHSTQILEKFAAPHWWVAHKEGSSQWQGSTYYPKNKSWSFLDILLVRKLTTNNKKWRLDKQSFRVLNGDPEQKDSQGFPKEFDPVKMTGVSDHWPTAIDILLEN